MRDYINRIENFQCEGCGPTKKDPYNFKNSDEVLSQAVPMVMDNRKEFGLEGLVKGLAAVIINTEKTNFNPAVKDLLDFTGSELDSSLGNDEYFQAILKVEDSADFIVRHAKRDENPFHLTIRDTRASIYPIQGSRHLFSKQLTSIDMWRSRRREGYSSSRQNP